MAWQSSNLCPARMRGHIASTGSPRSLRSLAITIILKCVNKKIKALYQVPLYGGVPRSGGVVREYKNAFPFCHCEPSQMAWQSSNLCPALMRDFITTGSPRSQCSLAMTRNEHAFPPVIASHRRWRGNPVNYVRTRMRATLFAL